MSGWQRDGRCDLTATKVDAWHDEDCWCTREVMTVEEMFVAVFASHLEPRGWVRLHHRSPNVLSVRHPSYQGEPGSPMYSAGPIYSALRSRARNSAGQLRKTWN